MKIIIKGIPYKVILFSNVEFIKVHSDASVAMHVGTRELHFREDHIKKNVIIHEVTHAFINSLCLGSCSNISLEDFEEIICELMEDHLMDINRISNEILTYLKDTKALRNKKRKKAKK